VPDGADHRFALKLLAWVVGIWLAGMVLLFEAAALPREASGTVIAVFPIGTETAQSMLCERCCRCEAGLAFLVRERAGGRRRDAGARRASEDQARSQCSRT
jgi:hypothetical protein